ncbi:MAG TPA: V-type ATPase 116kDa subunit family protein, partial [Candidatus Bathyarchaeia archaeon]|nr:V-type ATPase 116kDa subunit family protein [Candidatus Bathyarchaeia archaeon]
MLLPTKMRRVEIIVPQKKFEDVMLYLRELHTIELLDVKEMIKGYGEGVKSATVSDRLYRLTTLDSKINSVISALGVFPIQAKPVSVDARMTDQQIEDAERKIAEIEQKVTSTTNEKQALQSLINYAERQLKLSIEEITKIENVNSPEGRHKLEEIVSGIFQTLKPAEIKFAGPLSELIEQKGLEDAVVSDITENVAKILSTKRDESAIADTITQTLDLKMKAMVRSKRLSYEATSRIEQAKKKLAELEQTLDKIRSGDGQYLLVQSEVVGAERAFEQAKGLCGKTESTFMIEGWMPTAKVASVISQLKIICDGEVIVRSWTSKNGPTDLHNPKRVSIFQKLTIGFGIPKSDEVDPTVLWLITYPLFFGFMFGDVGNGIVVIIISAIIYTYKRRGLVIQDTAYGGMGGVFSMVIQGSGLLLFSGAAALVVGFLYGTVFGSVEWFRTLTGLPGPLWFEPFDNIRLMLRLSITIGVIHIISGLLLDMFNKAYVREYRELISGPLVWLWFYAAFGITLLQYGLRFPNYLFNPANSVDLFLRMGVPVIAMLVLNVLSEGPMGLMHTFESLLASLSHTISYVRILAMKLIEDVFYHLFLGVLVFFTAWGTIAGDIVGYALFAALTIVLILILETAFVFMQTLRLHWVEWFLKFYSGSGTLFKPYGADR